MALLITASSIRRVWQTDFWWQYATGRLIAEQGPPRVDTFSYTARGREWIEPRWLYCWGLAQTCDRFGVGTAIVAQWLAALAAVALVAAPMVRGRARTGDGGGSAALTAIVLTLAVLTARSRFTLRPEIVTYVCLALFYWIIERYRAANRAAISSSRSQGGRILLLLPLVQILWVNTHTLFVLGPVLVALFSAASLFDMVRARRHADAEVNEEEVARRRRTAKDAGLALVAVAIACLVNPYGPRVIGFTIRLFTEIHGTAFKIIQELESPFTYYGLFVSIAAYKVLIGLGALSMIVNIRRLDAFRTLFWGSQLYLSATAVRNLPLFALAAIPFTIDNFRRGEMWERLRGVAALQSVTRIGPTLGRLALLAIVGANVYWAWSLYTNRFYVQQFETNQFGLGIAEHRYPMAAADVMAEQVEGPVFSTMHESSYLIFWGYEAFCDPRSEVYDEETFRRFISLTSGQGDWDAAVQEFGISTALIDITFLPLIRQLLATPDWRLAYFDECAALFVRMGTLGQSIVDDMPPLLNKGVFEVALLPGIRKRLAPPVPYDKLTLFQRATSPTPYHRLANLLITLGRIETAEPFLRDAVAAYPGASGARVSLGQILESRGDAAGAQREYETAYRWSPDDPDVLVALGRFYAIAGRLGEASPLLERALERQPANALAWALTGEIAANAGRFQEAASRLERAVTLEPSNAMYVERLAEVRRAALGGTSPPGAPPTPGNRE